MKDTNNIIDFQSSDGGSGFQPVFPTCKHRRIILTPNQFKTHIGTLVDITSDKGKTINQQSKLAYLMEYIIKDACKRSNGGLTSYGINQNELRNSKLPDGSKINRDTLTRTMKNLIHHGIFTLIIKGKYKNHCGLFELGILIHELLDPIELDKKAKNTCNKDRRLYFNQMGFNFNEKKICPCCSNLLFITKFDIYCDKDNEAIIVLKPVCRDCEYEKKKFNKSPDGWDSAWSTFYLNIKMFNDLEVSITDIEEIRNRIEEREIDKLIAEAK